MQDIVYPFGQSLSCKRLWKDKARAQPIGLVHDPACRQSGHEDRRKPVPALVQLLHNMEAALMRQQKVQEKNVRPVPMERFGRLPIVLCMEHMEVSAFVQEIRQQHAKSCVVV